MMDETEDWVGTITESGLCTTMVGMITGLATERIGSCAGKYITVSWHWRTEEVGEVGFDDLANRCSLTAVRRAGEQWGEGERLASTVSQWKGPWFVLLVGLPSRENSDPGLFVWEEVGEYLLFVGEDSRDSEATRGRTGATRSGSWRRGNSPALSGGEMGKGVATENGTFEGGWDACDDLASLR